MEKHPISIENDKFLMTCIAAAIINIEDKASKKNSLVQCFGDNVMNEELPSELLVTYLSSLEGSLNALEGETPFLEMTSHMQLDRLNSFINESSESKLIYKLLDYAYNIISNSTCDNLSTTNGRHAQMALAHIGRLVLLHEKDVLGKLVAQLHNEIDTTSKQGRYYTETISANCTVFLENTEKYLFNYYGTLTNELFELNSESEADMLFQPWALHTLIEWSSFRPLRTILIDCVIHELASRIDNEMPFSVSSILVIDTASVIANRLRLEIFPTAPVSNANAPILRGRGMPKDKTRTTPSANDRSKEDLQDPMSHLLNDTLLRRPNIGDMSNLPSISKSHLRKTAFGVMNRATKNKFRVKFHEWKSVLEHATIGRSIEEPLYCEAVFQLAVIIEQMIQKSNSAA